MRSGSLMLMITETVETARRIWDYFFIFAYLCYTAIVTGKLGHSLKRAQIPTG